jgi:hypothetical protein
LTVRASIGSHFNEILGSRSQLSTLNVSSVRGSVGPASLARPILPFILPDCEYSIGVMTTAEWGMPMRRVLAILVIMLLTLPA